MDPLQANLTPWAVLLPRKICTHLLYSQYEGEKAITNSSQKNWDELYAFWHGVYTSGDNLYGKNTPHNVQNSRDTDFSTGFRDYSFDALNRGKNGLNSEQLFKVKLAFHQWNLANAATFAQATLKYAFQGKGKTGDNLDKIWGEAYTYFRFGAGLMTNSLVTYINPKIDPREVDNFPDNLFCDIIQNYLLKQVTLDKDLL